MPSDSLYDDITGEMEDYELALHESDSARMVRSMASSNLIEDGQSLGGIWCLFGIEAWLAAAGSPSKNENLTLIHQWGERNSCQLDPATAADMLNKVQLIKQLRISEGEDSELVTSAAEAMHNRINQAVVMAAARKSGPC